MGIKKYKTNPKSRMKCFQCRNLLNKYPEYYKFPYAVYCLDCGGEHEADYYDFQYDAYKEEEARKNGWSEEKQIEDYYLRKYGEY